MISKKVGIPLCIIVGIVLAFLVMFASETWGHDTPEIRNGDETHILTREWKTSYRKDRHWHEDADAGGAGAWDKCIAEAYDEDTDSYGLCEGRVVEEPVPTTRRQSTTSSTPTITTIEESLDNAQDTIPDEVVMPEPVEPEPVNTPVPCTETRVERIFYKGYTLYAPSVLSDGVETLSGLWERNWFTGSTQGAFYVVVDSSWLVYRGDGDVGDIPLRPDIGILVYQETNGTTAGLKGCPVALPMEIELNAGVNLIGFPTVPESIKRPSDLLSDVAIGVIATQRGEFSLVTQVGDTGDDLLTDGQGLIVITTQATTINLDVASAPSVKRKGTLATSWGAMKR